MHGPMYTKLILLYYVDMRLHVFKNSVAFLRLLNFSINVNYWEINIWCNKTHANKNFNNIIRYNGIYSVQ